MRENFKTESAILDGELVCVDAAVRPIFCIGARSPAYSPSISCG